MSCDELAPASRTFESATDRFRATGPLTGAFNAIIHSESVPYVFSNTYMSHIYKYTLAKGLNVNIFHN